MQRTFKLTLAYDGAAYCGWQVQSKHPSIQEKLELALSILAGKKVTAVASGRTDSGVHALAQVVSVDLDVRHTPEVLLRAINAHLPEDIRVYQVSVAADGFHAIRDCTGKRYRYLFQDGPVAHPLLRQRVWYIPQRLNIAAMNEAAGLLLGTHDFSSFEATGAARKSSIRTIRDISVARQEHEYGELVVFEVEADGFLYNMVRNIVGSLVKVGRGRKSVAWMADVLAAKSRSAAANTAPARALYLVRVDYDD